MQFDAIFLSLDGFDKLASIPQFLVLTNLDQVIVDFRKLDAVYSEAFAAITLSLALKALDLAVLHFEKPDALYFITLFSTPRSLVQIDVQIGCTQLGYSLAIVSSIVVKIDHILPLKILSTHLSLLLIEFV